VKITEGLRKLFLRGIHTLSGKAAGIFHSPRKPHSPLGDRLLADALRLAEIPSPTGQEEQRAAFVLERLKSLGLSPLVDETGGILTRLHTAELANLPPLLLFTNLGSSRWHPLESLSRLDADTAKGAGLADSLGAAALLSLAEGISTGRLEPRSGQAVREILLLFAARSFDNAGDQLFGAFVEDAANRPSAALGLRGLDLGTLVNNTRGIYRIKIGLSLDSAKGGAAAGAADGSVVDTLLDTAHKLSGITWDSEGTTRLYIRHIEAETSFGRTPAEGILEIELESSDGARLEMAMNTVKATVENAAPAGLKTEVRIGSFIPVGDPAVNQSLIKTLTGIMRDQRIKVQEEDGADIAAYLSNQGIPALSLGIAAGREGLVRDTVEIDSIEKGRLLLEALTLQLSREEP
jgi:hypothetical protein